MKPFEISHYLNSLDNQLVHQRRKFHLMPSNNWDFLFCPFLFGRVQHFCKQKYSLLAL